MGEVDSGRVALRFVNEINRHDLAALERLMAPDVRCVDRTGQETHGRERGRDFWAHEFEECPDFRIAIHDHLAQGTLVALFGVESGTRHASAGSPERRWSAPAAWRIVVREAHVSEWQVFSDPETNEARPLGRPA